jgi:hypothetical protein
MPNFENRTGRKAAQRVRTLLERGARIVPRTRGPKAASQELEEAHQTLARKDEEIGQLRARLAQRDASRRGSGIEPENIVWIFCSGRTGSSWLSRMMGELEGHTVWFEPWVGALVDPYHLQLERRKGAHFILSSQYRATWLASIRSLVLDGADARFPETGLKDYLIIKEPGGSVGAPLLMEALPESRMILLVRDPRDVVASWADAHKKGSWLSADEGPEASAERARRAASRYVRNIGQAKRAYDAHRGRKALVKYEDLREDALGTMKRSYSQLGVTVDEGELSRAVEKHSWENIPEEDKGEGKFYRKATPGGWREDLTPEQVEIVEHIVAPLLKEFYPESQPNVGG